MGQQERIYKVLISSTFKDLRKIRERIVRELNLKGLGTLSSALGPAVGQRPVSLRQRTSPAKLALFPSSQFATGGVRIPQRPGSGGHRIADVRLQSPLAAELEWEATTPEG